MAMEIIVVNGERFVRIPTKYITVKGRKRFAKDYGKECFFINIPIDKFDPKRYRG